MRKQAILQEIGFMGGPGNVAKLMKDFDWSSSPLGDPNTWPNSLKTIVQVLLHSKTQMFLAWGKDLTFLYNDAYIDVLGEKHPKALGRPMQESWSEVWEVVSPLIEKTLAGEALRFKKHPFTIYRNGRLEQAWFDFSYTPLYGDTGQVEGILTLLSETTQTVVAEKLLREETERLNQLFEEAPAFTAIFKGPDHTFELANKNYRRLVGKRDLIGKTVREALPEIEGQGYYELLDQVYRTGQPSFGKRTPVSLERAPNSPLEVRYVDFILQPMQGPDGQTTGIFVQGNDVTEHVLAEEECKGIARQAEKERERLRAILNTVPVGIVLADANGALVEANETHAMIWGGSLPETESIDDYSKWKGWWADGSDKHGQAIAPHEWAMAKALNGQQIDHDLVEIEPFDSPGTRKTILLSGSPVYDGEGIVAGAVIAQMDVSAQIQAENALRESEEKFRTIANVLPQLVWSILPSGVHDFYNERWFEFTGLSKDIYDSKQWKKIVHPDDLERAAQRWQHSVATGEPYEIEYRLFHSPSNEYRWALSRAVPIRDTSGKIVRWMGTSTDIHEQKLLAEELRLTNQRKDEFLAMLAHELRNPLAPINTAAELLKLPGADATRVSQASETIVRQVNHMTRLVDDLLDVSRVTRGLVILNKDPTDIKSVISNAIEQGRPNLEERQHALRLCIGAENALVYGDKTRLVQVLVNILNNAAKYTPQGGDIELKLEVNAEQVEIYVSDNGNGIEPSLLPHIFDLFTQGERTPDRSQGGLGLGLALVKSIMTSHEGTVEAYSDGPGKGSTFKLCLPVLKNKNLMKEKESSQAPDVGHAKPLKVMVVDDNRDAGQMLAFLLHAMGHETTVVEDGNTALIEAEKYLPQVFILDIGLPDMTGYELAKRLKENPKTRSGVYIALSGYGQDHDKESAKSAGFDHYLVKPVQSTILIEVLNSAR
jgi:PAS domain S-box-containing protein